MHVVYSVQYVYIYNLQLSYITKQLRFRDCKFLYLSIYIVICIGSHVNKNSLCEIVTFNSMNDVELYTHIRDE